MNKKELNPPRFREYAKITPDMRPMTQNETEEFMDREIQKYLVSPSAQIEVLEKAIKLINEENLHYQHSSRLPYVAGLLEGMICALQHSLPKL